MSPAAFQLILFGIQQGIPAIVQLAAVLRNDGAFTAEQKAQIDAQSAVADAAWDEMVAKAKAEIAAREQPPEPPTP